MRRLSRRMAQEKKGMRRRTKEDLFQPQVHLMMVQSYQIPKKNSKTVISHFHLREWVKKKSFFFRKKS